MRLTVVKISFESAEKTRHKQGIPLQLTARCNSTGQRVASFANMWNPLAVEKQRQYARHGEKHAADDTKVSKQRQCED